MNRLALLPWKQWHLWVFLHLKQICHPSALLQGLQFVNTAVFLWRTLTALWLIPSFSTWRLSCVNPTREVYGPPENDDDFKNPAASSSVSHSEAQIQRDLLPDEALMWYWCIHDTLIIVPFESVKSLLGGGGHLVVVIVADVSRRRLSARWWVKDIVYSLISCSIQLFVISLWTFGAPDIISELWVPFSLC